MASGYNKNRWELYNPQLPNEEQPHSFITKRKLEIMEQGIEEANIDLEVGEVSVSEDGSYGVEIIEDAINKNKKLNVKFPPAGQGAAGQDGKSAYDLWLEAGHTGTVQQFLDYLKGANGKDGKDGIDGIDGDPGPAGQSAYQIWIAQGNTGTEFDFLNSLKGTNGKDGVNGKDGINGKDGKDGVDGKDGAPGQDGKSAYQIWLDHGNTGTELDFLNSLKGAKGDKGAPGASAYDLWKMQEGNENKTITEFFASLKGEKGDKGDPGTGVSTEFYDF